MVRLALCGLGAILLLLPSAAGQQAARNSNGISNGLYRNSFFGFSYKVPYGWVERTAEMRDEDSDSKTADVSQAQVLLAIFERPPEVTGDTINSAVVIAAESVKSYPGLKIAADYFGPLEEITKAKGFKVINQPYEFSVGAKTLPREDFSKDLGKLTMQQASLVMIQKGYIVSFTFIVGQNDEIDDLVGGLNFNPGSPRTAPSIAKPKP